jgi:hypothetical protein
MQIIIKDKVQMNKVANACYRVRGNQWANYYYVPEGRKLLAEISDNPLIWQSGEDADEPVRQHHNTLVAIAQHKSNATWIQRSTQETHEKRRSMLGRMLRMYHSGDLTGDALFYKTMSNPETSNAEYPLTFKEEDGMEYWFITGMTDWFTKLNEFLDGDMSRSYNVADIPASIMVDKLRDMNLAESFVKT